MGQNLAPYVVERQHMSSQEVLEDLAKHVTGRDVGEFYIIDAVINRQDELEIELDDGCIYAFSCRKVN